MRAHSTSNNYFLEMPFSTLKTRVEQKVLICSKIYIILTSMRNATRTKHDKERASILMKRRNFLTQTLNMLKKDPIMLLTKDLIKIKT